jgi:hypothetical protein
VQGSPSADTVVTVQPSQPCGNSETASLTPDLNRVDWFVGPTDKTPYCNVPASKTAWYFSYVNHPAGGYFNYYDEVAGKGYVITMSYNSEDVNSYPEKGSEA